MSETEKSICDWTLKELDQHPRKGQSLTTDEICMWDYILGLSKLTPQEQEVVNKFREIYGEL